MKIKNLIILIILSLAAANFTTAQTDLALDKVKEIKLLESNRDDVRKIFAGYKSELGDNSDYDDSFYTKDAEIEITYSEGRCKDDESEGYDVAEWKAEFIMITPNDPTKPKEIGINLLEYKKEKFYYDRDDIYAYYNKGFGILFKVGKDGVEGISFSPPQKYYNLMCDKERAKILASNKSIFDRKLKDRISIIYCPVSSVEELKLSRTEIITDCDIPDSKKKKTCKNKPEIIEILTKATAPDGDKLGYSYFVSAGRIIGEGAKVKWDLTDVKPGAYKITAAVDDGCGFCGKTVTKTIVIKECPDCKQK